MNKKVVSLTLLLSLLATAGCDASAKAKTIKDENGDKVDVMYTYTDPKDGNEEETYVTADDVYADLLDSTAGSKALFEAVYKKVIEESISADKNKEIEKLIGKIKKDGYAIVPLEIYLENG